MPDSSGKVVTVDGRALRAQRSRDAIVDALYALVGEGNLEPTAAQVAERAQVAIRSVFRHFSDVESLYATLDARLIDEVRPLLEKTIPRGPLRDRVRRLARQRATIFERIAPYKRAGNLKRHRSDFLARTHRQMATQLKSQLLVWLPELASRAIETLEAVDQVTSFEAWDRLRGEQHLGLSRASAVVERTVLALIERHDQPRSSGETT